VLITFEGIEGSGKTTQCLRLSKELKQRGYQVIETREPGGTPFAERLRELLLNPGAGTEQIQPETEALLILAARRQHVVQVLEPALREGRIVLCDRFSDSTLAYQGYARGLDPGWLQRLDRMVTRGLVPDLTLLFDVPVPVGLARRQQTNGQNRLDREAQRFHERVRRGFLMLSRRYPHRIRRFDARLDPDRVAKRVAAIVLKFLQDRVT